MVAVAPPASHTREHCGQVSGSMYYTYVLRSKLDNKLYIGCSRDLKKRFKEHNDGMVTATKYKRPLELIYYEACLDENNAYKREKYFKTGYGRKYLVSRI